MATEQTARYFVLDGQPGQPFNSLRVRLIAGNPDNDIVVAIMTADLRSAGVESIVNSYNLTPESASFVTVAHPSALVVMS